jgi:pimeloyl-ACP methyl ester carboxylesterase
VRPLEGTLEETWGRVGRLDNTTCQMTDLLLGPLVFGLEDAVLIGHSAGCTVIWSFLDLFGDARVRALVLCDEMLSYIKRPEWSEMECRRYRALARGDEVLLWLPLWPGRKVSR